MNSEREKELKEEIDLHIKLVNNKYKLNITREQINSLDENNSFLLIGEVSLISSLNLDIFYPFRILYLFHETKMMGKIVEMLLLSSMLYTSFYLDILIENRDIKKYSEICFHLKEEDKLHIKLINILYEDLEKKDVSYIKRELEDIYKGKDLIDEVD